MSAPHGIGVDGRCTDCEPDRPMSLADAKATVRSWRAHGLDRTTPADTLYDHLGELETQLAERTRGGVALVAENGALRAEVIEQRRRASAAEREMRVQADVVNAVDDALTTSEADGLRLRTVARNRGELLDDARRAWTELPPDWRATVRGTSEALYDVLGRISTYMATVDPDESEAEQQRTDDAATLLAETHRGEV